MATGNFRQTFVAFFCCIMILAEGSCMRDSYWIKLSGPVTLDGGWVEFRSEAPLRADKDMQWVILDLETPFKENSSLGPGKEGGILTPDGDVINPEVEVVDQDGSTFKLVWSGTKWGHSGYQPPYPEKLPRNREYKFIRMRSPKPVTLKAVYWFCDSVKDWK